MRIRPSEYFKIDDEVEAWCFDNAVVTFGVAVEADLENHTENAKPKDIKRLRDQRFAVWMNDRPKFRDPAVRR